MTDPHSVATPISPSHWSAFSEKGEHFTPARPLPPGSLVWLLAWPEGLTNLLVHRGTLGAP